MAEHFSIKEARSATTSLLSYCQSNEWAGYDPYDALNSTLFKTFPFLNSRVPRLVFTQALKRSPFDFRRLLLIPKTRNPKAISLFLSAFLKLEKSGFDVPPSLIGEMIDRLAELRSPGFADWCWGYSFPWQTRTIVVPVAAPNLVCTTFVGSALLDAFEQRGETRCLSMAVSAADYILNNLYWTKGPEEAGFSYPLPSVRVLVHNANLLAAAFFCRVYKHTGNAKLLGPALRAARYAAKWQLPNGAWRYGEGPKQDWVDNFHTGYNLGALQDISNCLNTDEFETHIHRGFDFYREHFFRADGAARYFHDRTYPIDIHCVAQSVITLMQFRQLHAENTNLASSVLHWAMDHMWDDRGFFYYRVLRTCTIRTSYMRWSQAWMLLALATFIEGLSSDESAMALGQTR